MHGWYNNYYTQMNEDYTSRKEWRGIVHLYHQLRLNGFK